MCVQCQYKKASQNNYLFSDLVRKKPAVEKFLERNVRSLALVLAAEERSDLKSEDNPIEIDTFEINNERVDNATIDSTLASNVEEVKEGTDYDDVNCQEVKKLVNDNVGSDLTDLLFVMERKPSQQVLVLRGGK